MAAELSDEALTAAAEALIQKAVEAQGDH